MSNATLARPSVFAFSNGFGFQPITYTKDNGTLVYERVPVFRSGTFRDSLGIQTTWEKLHIQQMLTNYEHLRDNNLFKDIPVRDGHPGWIVHGLPGNGKVVGYHTNLVTENLTAPHDGAQYDYLLADFEITDPYAQQQIANKTWRNRSAEVGTYVTNSEAEFWPVYMGVAYVDIPAVEGLQFSRSQDGPATGSPSGQKYVFLNFTKESGVGETQAAAPAGTTGAPTQLPFAGGAAQVFSINGVQTSDPVAVQNHILTLETFRTDTVEKNRRDFVTGLANANKIAATQIDGLTAFALGLSPEQYAQWQQTYDVAPVQPVLGQHGQATGYSTAAAQPLAATGQPAVPAGVGSAVTEQEKQYAIWQETVRAHKLAGTSTEAIKNTSSYKKLIAAGQTVEL